MPLVEYGMFAEGFSTSTEFGELKVSGQEACGYRPYLLMVTAIVGCSGTGLRRELSARGVAFERIEVTADVERNPDAANRIEAVHLTFLVHGQEVSDESFERALVDMYSNSAMIQSVKECIRTTYKYKVV